MMAVDAVADAANKMFITTGIQFWMTPLAAASTASVLESVLRGKFSLDVMRSQAKLYKLNYLTPAGYKCIWSRNVKTT
jgi:hypothetical protein